MTDLEQASMQVKKRLSFLNYLAEAIPRGMKLAISILMIICLVITALLMIILTKQIDAEKARSKAIEERRVMAAEIHVMFKNVDSAVHGHEQILRNQETIFLKLSQAEVRGLINKSSMDTIKSILILHSKK